MKTEDKTKLARKFLSELAEMSSPRLQIIIRQVVGEDLAELMFTYAGEVISSAPEKVLENASSMLLLGYLLRAHEEGAIPPETPAAEA
jgi:hypothetical protein